MRESDKLFFDKLTKDRNETAQALDKPSCRGVKQSVVEKYSDQAHFIYELLQNADDAKATNARFVLEHDRLIFAHNGTRRFSVSDPEKEEMDMLSGRLGDINAIASIGNSNKVKESSIGKFGVGFKAVFQYTATPYIYDPEFCFKIEKFIVPVLIEEDFLERKQNETLFVFPFNHPDMSAEKSYEDIADKLENLSYPLLFLSNLHEIEFKFGNIEGRYDKNIVKIFKYETAKAEFICLTNKIGEKSCCEDLLLFSRSDECNRNFSVGFFLDSDGHLKPVTKPAFCFFPTKENTGLNFIIHAPFLLNDSREGIRAGKRHNDQMILKLADLAADAMYYLLDIGQKESLRLIDDTIVNIIPINEETFSDPADKSKISFRPFYSAIKRKFQSFALLPSLNGYTTSDHAYWAAVPQLTKLFTNEQLAVIVGDKKAHWIFTSLGHDETKRANRVLREYIASLMVARIDENTILAGAKNFLVNIRGVRQYRPIKGIGASFIEAQSIDWLHKFYKWIAETTQRKELCLDKPIFLNQEGKAIAAFDGKKQPILFLPVKGLEGYDYINEKLLENSETKKFIVEDVKIKEPSRGDYIYNIVLPRLKDNGISDVKTCFKLFFDYFCECPNSKLDVYVQQIKNCKFLSYVSGVDSGIAEACELYFPTDDLKRWFIGKPEIRFIEYDKYSEDIGIGQKDKLDDFLKRLGVRCTPNEKIFTSDDGECYFREWTLDGLSELVEVIAKEKDADLSSFLWRQLCCFIENNEFEDICHKELYVPSKADFIKSDRESETISKLKTSKWLFTDNGKFLAPIEIEISMLSNSFDVKSESAIKLFEFLGISEGEDYSNLTASQREKVELADELKKLGITTKEDLEALASEWKALQKKSNVLKNSEKADNSDSETLPDTKENYSVEEDRECECGFDNGEQSRNVKSSDFFENGTTQHSVIIKEFTEKYAKEGSAFSLKPENDAEDTDEDEFMPSAVDYSKKIERAKAKNVAEINEIERLSELQSKATELTKNGKYTYAWFKTLLQLESISSCNENSSSKEISISFARVEREPGTKRTLVLKYPNRYIPQFMEDLSDIPLILHMKDQKKTVPIEVVNVKSYTLRVKVKDGAVIENVDLESVTSATIDARSPAFLIEELQKRFTELNLSDDFNMKDNLCENIEFVFGPPGTGKTTYLAKNVILPIMKKYGGRMLVLTPTNKSADVLVKRIMEVSGEDRSYEEWLVRFGVTGDEQIEQSPVFRNKKFDIRTLYKNVTVTTIARFAYDFFMWQGSRVYLHGMNWDYIVIDEASMIPIADIIFPLYKKTPRKFIIAGDPFQIEPITSINLWKNENIYTMVELNSFESPKTKPHHYKVDLLTTQYRSVPDIGSIFSNFAYGGVLKHYRKAEDQKSLNLGKELGIQTLNIIKYPVSKYESIYRAKRLQHSSSYHVYSALFTFEYVCYLSEIISKNNPGGFFRIGIISPYRAQTDMIDKLLASAKLPPEIDVQVGTIHGFQGDECDIIFAVFNTPPTITDKKDSFLNKRNVINVCISRARDYLFVVMPDNETEGISNLRLISQVEKLIYDTNEWKEFRSHDLEDLMFNDSHYLENNAFSTGHQCVNVYGMPECRYEVRTEDNAVDVQLHRFAFNPEAKS